MINLNNPVQNSIFFYMILILIILYLKPKCLFKENNELKSFGYGENKTLFNFPVIVLSSGAIIYLLFSTIDQLNC